MPPNARTWWLLSAALPPGLDVERLRRQARTFFDVELSITPSDQRADGGWEARVEGARVAIETARVEEAGEVLRLAHEAVRAVGGAGFDVLVAKARRVYSVSAVHEADRRAPLLVCAVMASVLLSPIVPPEGGTIFGVRGARERLSRET